MLSGTPIIPFLTRVEFLNSIQLIIEAALVFGHGQTVKVSVDPCENQFSNSRKPYDT